MTSRTFFPLLAAGAVATVLAAALVLPVAQETPPAKQQEKATMKDEFVSLFDGVSLAGWEGEAALWRVEDGAITGETRAEAPVEYNTFLKWKDGEVDDFELVLEYRIFSGNSGIQVRSFALDKPNAIGGYQADIDAGGSMVGDKLRRAVSRCPREARGEDDHQRRRQSGGHRQPRGSRRTGEGDQSG